ncbi:MAG: hypothetical protein CVT59_02755 [Actinobacteria bacterium HGW-Actinobacteria-1]|jgi:hypothetical protein|nr:MAG: hypothetical protein CVT59_02755 [Actinobacteria bacterium HGW-Actinobacteria-1]
MPSRKLLKSVVRGFVGTYVSRYSDFDGYLLFGFGVDSMRDLTVDLTRPVRLQPAEDALDEWQRLATFKFQEQLSKVGLPISVLQEATLRICRTTARRGAVVLRGVPVMVDGFDVDFSARAVTDLGRVYEASAREFIAPQDPGLFDRSGRSSDVCLTRASS